MSVSNLSDIQQQLSAVVGADHCLTTRDQMEPYSSDWGSHYLGTPVAVVKPADTREVAALMPVFSSLNLGVIPAGGRTGLSGGAIAEPGRLTPIILSLERLNKIREIDAQDFSLVADAGCVVENVQQAASDADRLFAIQWGAQGSAQIGGMLATNAGGIRTLCWGNARDLVLGLEVVLPDGRILDDLRRVRKDNSGYALRHIFIGSEGTLGIITAAALRLRPVLRRVETAFVAVKNPAAALQLHERMLESGADLVAFELINRYCLEIVERFATGVSMPLNLEGEWYVMVEIAAAHPDVPLRSLMEDNLAAAFEAEEITDAALADSDAQRQNIWKIREDSPSLSHMAGPAIHTDTAVPVSSVPVFIDRVLEAIQTNWPQGRVYALGHAGDGNIHVSLQCPEGWSGSYHEWTEEIKDYETTVNDIAVALGGSFSAEHGVGQSKRSAMSRYKDPVALDLMRALKSTFDPEGRMNPGKLLP